MVDLATAVSNAYWDGFRHAQGRDRQEHDQVLADAMDDAARQAKRADRAEQRVADLEAQARDASDLIRALALCVHFSPPLEGSEVPGEIGLHYGRAQGRRDGVAYLTPEQATLYRQVVEP